MTRNVQCVELSVGCTCRSDASGGPFSPYLYVADIRLQRLLRLAGAIRVRGITTRVETDVLDTYLRTAKRPKKLDCEIEKIGNFSFLCPHPNTKSVLTLPFLSLDFATTLISYVFMRNLETGRCFRIEFSDFSWFHSLDGIDDDRLDWPQMEGDIAYAYRLIPKGRIRWTPNVTTTRMPWP